MVTIPAATFCADVVGIFRIDPAIIRLIVEIKLEQNDAWLIRRHLTTWMRHPLSVFQRDVPLRLKD